MDLTSVIISVVASVTAALPPTLVALAALRQGKKVEEQGKKVEEKTSAVADKADDLLTKTAEIHVQTNSNLSTVMAALDVANAKIEGLQKLTSILSDAKAASDNLAATVAAKVELPSPPPPPKE